MLRFISARDDLRKLARMPKKSVLAIPGIGKKYGGIIAEWQKRAQAALMTAVARHIEKVPQSRAYYEKKRREGKKHNQAI